MTSYYYQLPFYIWIEYTEILLLLFYTSTKDTSNIG